MLARVFVWLAFDSYDRRTNTIARSPLGHVFTMHIKLIGRSEIVERGVPLRARVRLVCEHEIALRSGHS